MVATLGTYGTALTLVYAPTKEIYASPNLDMFPISAIYTIHAMRATVGTTPLADHRCINQTCRKRPRYRHGMLSRGCLNKDVRVAPGTSYLIGSTPDSCPRGTSYFTTVSLRGAQ